MADPQRLPTGDTEAGDAAHLTGEPDTAATDLEPSSLPSTPFKFDVQDIVIGGCASMPRSSAAHLAGLLSGTIQLNGVVS